MMMKTVRLFMLAVVAAVLMIVVGSEPIHAALSQEEYNRLSLKSIRELYNEAHAHQANPDSVGYSIALYSLVATKVGEAKSREDQQACVKALAEISYLSYFLYFDFSNAVSNIEQANMLMERFDFKISEVDLYQGLIYASIGEQSRDYEVKKMAKEYLHKAFDLAAKEKNVRVLNLAFCNLVSLCYESGTFSDLKDSRQSFKEINEEKGVDDIFVHFNLKLYDILDALTQKDYASSLANVDSLIAAIPEDSSYGRYISGIWEIKGMVYADQGKNKEAMDCYNKALQFSEQFNLLDAKLSYYRDIYELSEKMGLQPQALDYHMKFLTLKDSLLSFSQIRGIEEARYLGQINVMQDQVKESNAKRKRMQMAIVLCVIIICVIGVLLYFVVSRARMLRKKNEALYLKNIEALKAQENERRLRKALESGQAQKETSALERENPQDAEPEKTKKASLDETEVRELAEKIRNVMESDPAIYDADFSVEQLADLVGDKYRKVAVAISDVFGSNFNTLLNNYRIREALRRFTENPEYRNHTIEAISQSVGFKSRSTFVLQFKRVTGLTPSQYLEAAKTASENQA